MEDTPDMDTAAERGTFASWAEIGGVVVEAPKVFTERSLTHEPCLSNMGVTGVENAGGGEMMGPESDIGDSMTTSGGVGGKIGDGSVIG